MNHSESHQEPSSFYWAFLPLALALLFSAGGPNPTIAHSAVVLFLYSVVLTYVYRTAADSHARDVESLKKQLKGKRVVISEMEKAASYAGGERGSLKREIERLTGKLVRAEHFVAVMKDDAQQKVDPLGLRHWGPVKGNMFSVNPVYDNTRTADATDKMNSRETARADKATKESEALRREVKALKKQLRDLEEKSAKAALHENDKLEEVHLLNEDLTTRLYCVKTQVTGLESEIAQRTRAFHEVNDENCRLAQKIFSLEQGSTPLVEPLNQKISSLEQEVEALRSANSAKKTQLKHLRDGLRSMKKRFSTAAKKANRELAAKSRALSVADANTSGWYQKLEDLSRKFAVVSEERYRFWAETVHLQGQLDDAPKKLKQAEEKQNLAETRELLEKKKRLEAEQKSDEMYDEKMEYEATLRQYEEDFEERLADKKEDFDKKMDAVKKEAARRKARLDAAEGELKLLKETSKREMNKAKAALVAQHKLDLEEKEKEVAKEVTELKRKHAASLRAATAAAEAAELQKHEASAMEVEGNSAGGQAGGSSNGKRMQVLESLVESLRESNRSMRAEGSEAKKAKAKAAALEEEAAMLKRRISRLQEDLSNEKKIRCDAQDALEAMTEGGHQETT